MMPMEHPWTDWQIDTLGEEKPWKWKENTPKEMDIMRIVHMIIGIIAGIIIGYLIWGVR